MQGCPHPGCGWTSIAPSAAAAREQFGAHVVAAHGREVDADVPSGSVQVRHDGDDDWVTVDADDALDGHPEH